MLLNQEQMKRNIFRLIQAVFFLNLIALPGLSQEPTRTDTLEVAILAIPVTDVIIRATDVNTQLREKRTILLTDEQKQEIRSRLDTLKFRLALLREDPRIHRSGELNLRSLL